MTKMKEIRVPNVCTRRAADDDMVELELESAAAVATLERPAAKDEHARAGRSSTGHAELFTVDLLGGWLKP